MTDFIKESDYEISVQNKEKEIFHSSASSSISDMIERSELTRTFNFLSEKITTVHTKAICQAATYKDGASSAAIAMNTSIEYFRDLPSLDEVKMMHEKLITLGGRPPAWEKIDKCNTYFQK